MEGCLRRRICKPGEDPHQRGPPDILAEKRIAETRVARHGALTTTRPCSASMSATPGVQEAQPPVCLVSHRATGDRDHLAMHADALPGDSNEVGLTPACLVPHRAAGEVNTVLLQPEVQTPALEQVALPATLDEWIDATAIAVAKALTGKAPGRDRVINKIIKAAGPPFVVALASCLHRWGQDVAR